MSRKPVVGIVGGGMVGGALAALLAQERSAFERIVLIEAGPPPTVGDDSRFASRGLVGRLTNYS